MGETQGRKEKKKADKREGKARSIDKEKNKKETKKEREKKKKKGGGERVTSGKFFWPCALISFWHQNLESNRGENIAQKNKWVMWDSNPRVLANMGLAIPRPTRLGDPRLSDDLDFLLLY